MRANRTFCWLPPESGRDGRAVAARRARSSGRARRDARRLGAAPHHPVAAHRSRLASETFSVTERRAAVRPRCATRGSCSAPGERAARVGRRQPVPVGGDLAAARHESARTRPARARSGRSRRAPRDRRSPRPAPRSNAVDPRSAQIAPAEDHRPSSGAGALVAGSRGERAPEHRLDERRLGLAVAGPVRTRCPSRRIVMASASSRTSARKCVTISTVRPALRDGADVACSCSVSSRRAPRSARPSR